MGHLDSKLDLEKEIRNLMSNDKSLTRGDAIEEVIADASAKALSKITEQDLADLAESNPTPVSYTHLDVYKRQVNRSAQTESPIDEGYPDRLRWSIFVCENG